MQDGNSDEFVDGISESVLKQLEDQYPENEEFRAGYFLWVQRRRGREKVGSGKFYGIQNGFKIEKS